MIFENTGKLINFISSDRYIEEENDQGVKQYNKREWMTPIKEYSNFNSLNMPSRAVAIWNLPEGQFEYADFTIKSVEYNVNLN